MAKQKRNPNLRVVKGEEVAMLERRVPKRAKARETVRKRDGSRKKQFQKHMLIAFAAIMFLITGVYLFITFHKYTDMDVVYTADGSEFAQDKYITFADGILRYGLDKVSLMDTRGKEKWSHACQLHDPEAKVSEESAAVADIGGNEILVFDKKGLKGKIQTTKPIQKVVVSGQGIVSVLLKEESTAEVVCYDAAGNILVENRSSFRTAGYPVDIAISRDGYILAVSYLLVEENVLTSKVVYYDFGGNPKGEGDYKSEEFTYKDEVIPSVFFMGGDESVMVGSKQMILCQGTRRPKVNETVKFDKEVKSLFYNKDYIGIIFKGKSGSDVLGVYTANGKELFLKELDSEYGNMKIEGDEVILYDGKKCSIFTAKGVHRFEGELEEDIVNIFPSEGMNKYCAITMSGLKEMRLTK